MGSFDAISAVSGGSWAASIYVFANKSKDQILGDFYQPLQPESLTMEFLRTQPSLLRTVATESMRHFFEQDFSAGSEFQTMWGRYVRRTILVPAGLGDLGDNTFLAASAEDVARIQRDNPSLQGAGFLVPQPDRPLLVINGAILAPLGYDATSHNVVSIQISPDFTGSPFFPNDGPVNYVEGGLHFGHRQNITAWVGGGLVETFAFGGDAPEEPQQAGGSRVQLPVARVPFSLKHALAISSAAFAKLAAPLTNIGISSVGLYFDPQSRLWPVSDQHQKARVYNLGDGGDLENVGLLAMLQRGARRIVWLVNTDVGVSAEEPFCNITDVNGWNPTDKVTNQMTDKFGFGANSDLVWLTRNQVFAREDLPPLLCKMQRLKLRGRPAVVRASHTVMQNSWWGIEGGFTVDILYVYNDKCTQWESRLPAETRHALEAGTDGPFAHFPFYKTTFQNPPEFTSLTEVQVQLLAALAEHSVLENAQDLRSLLSG